MAIRNAAWDTIIAGLACLCVLHDIVEHEVEQLIVPLEHVRDCGHAAVSIALISTPRKETGSLTLAPTRERDPNLFDTSRQRLKLTSIRRIRDEEAR